MRMNWYGLYNGGDTPEEGDRIKYEQRNSERELL